MGWVAVDLTTLTQAPLATFTPSAYVFPSQVTQHIVYQGFTPAQGSDGHIHELYWNNPGWHHNDLTLAASAPQVTLSPWGYLFPDDRTQHVVYQGAADGVADGRIHELWWDSDGWHHNDLTGAIDRPAAPAAINVPMGYQFSGQRVFYQGRDQHVHELFWQSSDSGWHLRDLTQLTHAPITGGPPFGYPFRAQSTQHVNYVGTDGHVHELWWRDDTWQHNDLTAATGAPAAADQPCGYAFEAQNTQHVIYVGVDRHIHELWWNADGWHHNDLTTESQAPMPLSARPSGYVFDEEGTQHVDYLGVDGHVHELTWHGGRSRPGHPVRPGWSHEDLTALTGGPEAISPPAGYVYAEFHTRHVIHVSDQHRVIELFWQP
jgi:hypothetical protein